MSVLENAKAHFKQQMSNGLLYVEVPEWDTRVYFKPQANFQQQYRVLKLHSEGKLAEALIETLLIRALTEDGKQMFGFGDRDVLMREVDPEVILRVVTAINEKQREGELLVGN